jgi:hypothetical protein
MEQYSVLERVVFVDPAPALGWHAPRPICLEERPKSLCAEGSMEVWTSIPCPASGPRSCSDMTIRIVDGTSSSVQNRKPSRTQTDATRTPALTSVQPPHS